jgi:SAM-dependent methyltransferase
MEQTNVAQTLRSVARSLPLVGRGYRWLSRKKASWRFRREYRQFEMLSRRVPPRFSLTWEDRYPCLEDRTATTSFDHHYIYHTAWAARVLARLKPEFHVDISSTLYFCGIVSAFLPVRFYDYRPADLRLGNLKTARGDLLNLPFDNRSLPSVSCLHVVEHVGLGRYGDPLDPEGDLRSMAELQRVIAPGGHLIFAIPVGRPRIHFNAHRIYAYHQIIEAFSELRLCQFSLIADDPTEGMVENASAELVGLQSYGCGCFLFQRPEEDRS